MKLKDIAENPTTRYVDVRSEIEFNTGHVNGATNIPLDQLPQRYKEIKQLGETPVVFYCRSGNRSGQAVNYLQQLGLQNIYNGGTLEDIQHLLSR